MKIILRPSILICVLFLMTSVLWADSPGKTGAEFLKVGVGSRAMALGGSYVALADDAFSMYWNPAGLARVRRREAAAQVNSYFQGVDQNFLAYAHKSERNGVYGISLNLFGVSDIPKTTVSANGAVNSVGTFDASDMALSLGYARSITGWFLAGGAAKYIRSTIASYDANTYAFDGGVIFLPISRLSVGFTLQNVGPRYGFMRDKDSLPILYRMGVAGYLLKNRQLVLTLDLSQAKEEIMTASMGCEYTLMNMYSFRVGYLSANTDVDRGLTAGFGLRYRMLGFEYAFVPYGILGDTHRYSLRVWF